MHFPSRIHRFRNRISRRTFLEACTVGALGTVGIGAGVAASLSAFASNGTSAHTSNMSQQQRDFLSGEGRRYSGLTLRIITEDTPPSRACREIALREFAALTGIDVDWELAPLRRVLAKTWQDVNSKAGRYDVYYVDHSWLASMSPHVHSPELLLQSPEIAYPDFDFPDFLEALVDKTASHDGRLVGIPYDIPIMIMAYRRDVLESLGLSPPRTMDEYQRVVQAVQAARAPAVFGTVGQWKAGHYSLVCAMSSWLWGHGGSFFKSDRQPGFLDDQAASAMDYMLELGKCMPPGATAWDWDGQTRCFTQGNAAIAIVWSEQFPQFDDPARSSVVGLVEPAPCPQALALRPPSETSFGETPGVSHQGGSCIALSRYSQSITPAWLFMQWVTSKDVSVRASLLGGGASLMRRSCYDDPRIAAQKRVGSGTTRHLDVTMDAITRHMGTEPHLDGWDHLAVDGFAVELGRMVTGQQGVKATLRAMQTAAGDHVKSLRDNA